MTRDKALRQIETIIESRLEMHGADLGPRGQEAVRNAVQELQGLVREIFDDVKADQSSDRFAKETLPE